MYKIMLADDEGIVIDSLKFIIEKEFKDTCEVQYAKTGRSVIELAESFRPDVAVMDIQMPGINGIDAMKEIRRSNNHTVFIVMSAYDKFNYAKEAIKLGVMEYITKPMEKTRIIAALQKAMERIDAERLKRKNELLIKEKLETVVPIIESGLIHNILLQEHFREDIENYRSILGITLQYAYMIAVVCGDEQQGNHMTNAVGSSVRMQRHYQEVRDCLKENFDCIVGTVMANKLAVLVPYEKDVMDYNERIELIEKARELTRYLRKRTDISFRIGIGEPKDFLMASESYTEALNALVATTGSVAHVDDLPIKCEYGGNYPVKLEKKLFAEVEDGDIDNASASASAFFDWMVDSGSDLMNMRLKVLEFALWSEHIAYEKGGMIYQLNSRAEYLPQVMEAEYRLTAKKLVALHIFSDLDYDMLARYFIARAAWQNAQNWANRAIMQGDAKEAGSWTKTANVYFGQCQSCAAALGLSVSARCRLVMPEPPKDEADEDPLSKMLRERAERRKA